MEKILSLYIYWDPAREFIKWKIPFLERPILWYGIFFALGFFLGYLIFQHLLKEFLSAYRINKKEAYKIAEQVSLYVILGTIIGARLGDVLFYQNPADYLHDPFGIFKFWEGGLSSHGGVFGILMSTWVFCLRIRKKYPMLTWVAMLDLLVIPALLAGSFIRVGNFFNQEILGIATKMPWGVVFGHPAGGGAVIARHPVQLYEALFYFAFFVALFLLRKKVPKIFILGKTSGLFFIGTFAFRFLIEFLKMPQSVLVSHHSHLDVGQWLSLPLICLGFFFFFFFEHNLVGSRSVKRN